MAESRQLKYGAMMSYLSIAINMVSGLLYTPWVIRTIGKEDYGLYTLAMSVIGLFVFDFGLSSAVTRFISKYVAEKNQEGANRCLGIVYKMYIAIDIILFIVLVGVFFFIPQIYKELTPVEISRFEVIYVVAAIYSVVSFPFIPVNGVLTAHERFVELKFCDVFHKIIVVVLMTICLLCGLGLYALVFVNAVAGLICIILKIWCIRRSTPQKVLWHYSNRDQLIEIAGYSGLTTIKSLSQRCIMNIAPSILGYFSGSAEIAVLGISISLEGYTFTIANAMNGLFLPRVSREVAQQNDLLPLMIKVGRLQLFIIGLIVLGVCIFGKEFISLWVGEQFRDSYVCTVLMVLPALFHLPQEIAHQAVYAMNRVKYEAFIFAAMALCNMTLAFTLAPHFGAIGIGVSVFISYMLRTIGMDVLYYVNMKIDVVTFFKESFLRLSPLLIIMIIVGFAINYLIPNISWLSLGIKVLSFCLVYLLVSFVFMNDYEKKLINSIIKR